MVQAKSPSTSAPGIRSASTSMAKPFSGPAEYNGGASRQRHARDGDASRTTSGSSQSPSLMNQQEGSGIMVRGEFTQMTVQGIQADVERFMEGVGQALPPSPRSASPAVLQLRIDLITEEFDETVDALVRLQQLDQNGAAERKLLAEVADGIGDLIYVAIGTASALGIDMEPVWEAIQETNMAKVGMAEFREDGKYLKPDGWKPPNIEVIIREQIAEHDFADRSIK